jgi:hypothetical protein
MPKCGRRGASGVKDTRISQDLYSRGVDLAGCEGLARVICDR